MEVVKKADNYTVFKKRNGRFAVKSPLNKFMNADEKTKILLAEGLIKVTAPKKVEEPVAEESAAEETPATEE